MAEMRPIRICLAWACLDALLVLFGVACTTTTITGSGTVTTKPVTGSSFSKIEVGDAFDVNLTVGDADQAIVRVDDNLVDHLDVGVTGETLHLSLKPRTSVRSATLHADVTVRSLSDIEVSGAGQVHLSGAVTGQRLSLMVSGAGGLDGTIRVGEANVELSGASRAKLAGTAGHLVVKESGASDLEADQLQAEDLTVNLSGASTATASVTNTVSAKLSGASSLRYGGSPTFTRREVSGGSSITSL
jgi:hypothetical protein